MLSVKRPWGPSTPPCTDHTCSDTFLLRHIYHMSGSTGDMRGRETYVQNYPVHKGRLRGTSIHDGPSGSSSIGVVSCSSDHYSASCFGDHDVTSEMGWGDGGTGEHLYIRTTDLCTYVRSSEGGMCAYNRPMYLHT